MKRLRWVVVVVAGVALAGALAAVAGSVIARSSSYAPGLLEGKITSSTVQPVGGWYWLKSNRDQVTWTFDVTKLQSANRSYVFMNFAAKATNANGGCGLGSQLAILVRGAGTGLLSGQITNPWRPHIAAAGIGGEYGWDANGAVNLPSVHWLGAKTITVTVSPATLDRQVGLDEESLLIGYIVG